MQLFSTFTGFLHNHLAKMYEKHAAMTIVYNHTCWYIHFVIYTCTVETKSLLKLFAYNRSFLEGVLILKMKR